VLLLMCGFLNFVDTRLADGPLRFIHSGCVVVRCHPLLCVL